MGAPALADLLVPDDLAHLRAAARRVRYADGQMVHGRGDPATRLSLVVQGAVRFVRRGRDGRLVTVSACGAGQSYGYLLASRPATRTHEAVAVGPTLVDHVARADLENILEARPRVMRALLELASVRLMIAIDLYDDARRLPPRVRLAKLLLLSLGAEGDVGVVEGLQEDLAQALGVSDVTLTTALRALADLGLVETGYRRVLVPSAARLRAWIEAQDPD